MGVRVTSMTRRRYTVLWALDIPSNILCNIKLISFLGLYLLMLQTLRSIALNPHHLLTLLWRKQLLTYMWKQKATPRTYGAYNFIRQSRPIFVFAAWWLVSLNTRHNCVNCGVLHHTHKRVLCRRALDNEQHRDATAGRFRSTWPPQGLNVSVRYTGREALGNMWYDERIWVLS